MSRFNLYELSGECTKCNKNVGSDCSIHAWHVYCHDCYDQLVKEGKIEPPSHYVINKKAMEKDVKN
jgi:hypothetical protein